MTLAQTGAEHKGFQTDSCHFHFQFLNSVRVRICSHAKMCLFYGFSIYTLPSPFEGCFLMTLQENPAYTIFFFGEIRNPLEIRFLLRNVNVQSQKMMQLKLNVLMLSNTEIRL